MSTTADIVIIGAGSSGSSLAYHLAGKGVKNILVLEKLGAGSGATGHAAGLIRHHYPDRSLVRMVRYCSERFAHFQEEMGRGIDYSHNEFIYLTPGNQQGIGDIVKMQQEEGVNVEMLSPAQVAHIHPKGEMNVDGLGWGLLDHDAGYADPYKVAAGYCDRARELGVEVKTGVQVLDIAAQGGRITKLITNKGSISPGLVINAAGLGAAAVNARLGINLPLRNFSLGHAMLIPDTPFEPDIITVCDASVEEFLFFLRPESGGTALLGMDQDDFNREFDPATYYMDAPFDKLGRFYQYVVKRMPFAGNYRLSTAFGALDVVTPDWNPGMGFLAGGPENYYQIVGGSGHSFKLSPVIGLTAAQDLLGESRDYDLSCFDVNRLSQAGSFGGSFFRSE